MDIMAETHWITRREAAELAGVHMNTIRLWEQAGRVRTQKTESGIVTIPRDEIERIMGERHDASQSDKEKIAALEVEVRMLRAEIERERTERATLLSRVVELAGGQDR